MIGVLRLRNKLEVRNIFGMVFSLGNCMELPKPNSNFGSLMLTSLVGEYQKLPMDAAIIASVLYLSHEKSY